jgi:hypothetical protein
MSYFKRFLQPFLSEDDGVNLGGNDGEVADPQPSPDNLDNPDLDNPDDGVKDPEPAKPVQDNEENARYAAARRESERIAREAQEKAARLERDNMIARKYSKDYEVYSEEDIKARFGANGINTLEDFEREIQSQALREAGLDPDIINQAVKNHPAIKQAEQYNQYLEQQQKAEFIKSSIEELHKEVPGTEHIKTVQDLDADPKANEIVSWIQRGYTFADAYYKAYKNDIQNRSTKTAVQSTIANLQDKAKRGVVNGNDGGGEDATLDDLSPEGKRMSSVFGTNPSNIAKYVKSQLKK